MHYIENNIGINHLMCFKQQSIKTEPSQNKDMVKSGTSGTTSSPAPFGAYRNGEEKRRIPDYPLRSGLKLEGGRSIPRRSRRRDKQKI